jgi:hypothetical protein
LVVQSIAGIVIRLASPLVQELRVFVVVRQDAAHRSDANAHGVGCHLGARILRSKFMPVAVKVLLNFDYNILDFRCDWATFGHATHMKFDRNGYYSAIFSRVYQFMCEDL